MSRYRIRVFLSLISCCLTLLLSGCALRALFGNVIIAEDIGDEVNEIISTVFSNSTAAVCLDTDYGFYECTYIIGGEIITSTLYLLGEYGVTGVLIDPAVVQIPEGVSDVSATYDDGNGAKPLSIQMTNNFQVTPDTTVNAEPGHEFIILGLPAPVANALPEGDPEDAPEFSYTLTFTHTQPIHEPIAPMELKVMLTGRVEINRHIYHVPILPCVTDFSAIPAITAPQSGSPVDLLPAVNAILQGGITACDHRGYSFNNVPPPPVIIYLPLAVN